MKENQKKAFDFAADTTKQLITLSTAIITLTVTFSKDIISSAINSPESLLIWTWFVFIASICFGVWTLMALTGTLQPITKSKKESEEKEEQKDKQQEMPEDEYTKSISINEWNVRLPSILQIFCFIAAIIMTGVFGYKSVVSNRIKDDHKNCYPIIRETKLGIDSTKYIDTLFVPKK